MFQRMLVPLDGSAPAERALSVAVRLARALDGTLILVRVVHPPLQPATALAPPLGVEAKLLSEELERVTAYLAQVAQQPELAGIRHETVTPVGSPAEMILDAVHTHQADSVILCSHGRTGLLRWALGSVAQRVVHHASAPVLVFHQQGPTLAMDAQRPLRALIPLDGSELAEAALGPAATLVSALAPQGQGILHLVQVVGLPLAASEAALREAEAYLSRTAEHLRKGAAGAPPSYLVCQSESRCRRSVGRPRAARPTQPGIRKYRELRPDRDGHPWAGRRAALGDGQCDRAGPLCLQAPAAGGPTKSSRRHASVPC